MQPVRSEAVSGPVVLALRQWGEDWGHGKADVVLADRRDGRPIRRLCVQAEDGRRLELDDLMWINREEAEAARTGEAA